MALNVKAAMLVCGACICGMSWLLHQVGLPQMRMPSPLVAAAGPRTPAGERSTTGERKLAAKPSKPKGIETPAGSATRNLGTRAAWAEGFKKNSMWTEQTVQNRTNEPSLAVLPVAADLEPSNHLPPVLPPLVYVPPAEPDALAEAVAPTAGELRPESPVEELPGRDELLAVVVGEAGGVSGGVSGDVASTPTKPEPGPEAYTVVRGDTLTKIVRKLWNTEDPRLVELLVAHNPPLRGRVHRVNVGEALTLPTAGAVQRVLAGGAVAAEMREKSAPEKSAPETAAERWYTIQAKDSLAGIAQRFLESPARWREIAKLNGLTDPNKIRVGMRIKLPPTLRMAQR